MKCISAAFKAALKQDFGEEHTLRRRPFPVLSFSKTQKSAHLENKPIVGAESPPPGCAWLTEAKGREAGKDGLGWQRERAAGKNWEEKMNDEGDGGVTGEGVRWQAGRDGWGGEGRRRVHQHRGNKVCATVSASAGRCKSVIKSRLLLMYCTCLGETFWELGEHSVSL